MSFQNKHTYPTFVYANEKHYFADCSELNLVSIGESPSEAIENLQAEVDNVLNGKLFSLKPIFEQK